ncbi:MAG: septal ring lytic transglycosylase RlpA family protein [Hyphomicrobiales bacterium]
MLRAALTLTLIFSLAVAISACGGGGQKLGERVIPLGQPVPKGGGRYLVGEPYDIAGTTYYPNEDPNYDRTGQASWYGELFHGRYTANGEIYDMDRLSAAHPTLPLPVYAQVTNLNNGRTIIVRVNDRGPFRKDRIIDLSRRSAEALGFRSRGTATVRVKYLGRAPLNGDDSYEQRYLASRGLQRYASTSAPSSGTKDPIAVASTPAQQGAARPVAMAAIPASPAAGAVGVVKGSPEATGSTAPLASAGPRLVPSAGPQIQAGSFKNKDNAERARSVLSPIAPVDVAEVDVGGEIFYRVRVGPFPGQTEAAAALPRVTAAGYRGAKIIMQN